MPLLDLLNYRGMEREYLDGHLAGGTADLAWALRKEYFDSGRLRHRFGPRVSEAVVELTADFRGYGRHDTARSARMSGAD